MASLQLPVNATGGIESLSEISSGPRVQQGMFRYHAVGAAPAPDYVAGRSESSSTGDSHGSLENDDDDEQQTGYGSLLELLSSRGTGSYQCPHGTGCTKGGRLPGGSIKVFTRNSDFK